MNTLSMDKRNPKNVDLPDFPAVHQSDSDSESKDPSSHHPIQTQCKSVLKARTRSEMIEQSNGPNNRKWSLPNTELKARPTLSPINDSFDSVPAALDFTFDHTSFNLTKPPEDDPVFRPFNLLEAFGVQPANDKVSKLIDDQPLVDTVTGDPLALSDSGQDLSQDPPQEFIIGKLLGEGRLAQVFEAKRSKDSQICAVKLFKTNVDFQGAYDREVRAFHRLQREDGSIPEPIVKLLEETKHEQRLCLVLEWWGCDLRRALRRQPDSKMLLREVRQIGSQLLKALVALDGAGLAHFDGGVTSEARQYPGLRCVRHQTGRLRLHVPHRDRPRLPGAGCPTLSTA